MLAVQNTDCSMLTLTAEALSLADGKTFDSLVLRSKLNCSSTESSVDVSSLIDSIADNSIVVPATLFYSDENKDTFCDGVYYFQLDITYTTGSGVYLVEDSACILIDCSIKCDIIDAYTKTKDKSIWYLYTAITYGNSCDSCSCVEMCSLYTELKNLIYGDTYITNTDTGCGCS